MLNISLNDIDYIYLLYPLADEQVRLFLNYSHIFNLSKYVEFGPLRAVSISFSHLSLSICYPTLPGATINSR